jgi:hypothetical protein
MAGERNIFEELKQALLSKNSAVEASRADSLELNKDEQKIRELNDSFSKIIKERDALLENYDMLISKKLEINQSIFTLLIAAFYSSKIDASIKSILSTIDFINTFNSNEFYDRVKAYIQSWNLKNNEQSVDDEFLSNLKKYFSFKLNEAALILGIDLPDDANYTDDIMPLSSSLSSREYAIIDLMGLLALSNPINTYNDIVYKSGTLIGTNSTFISSFLEDITLGLKTIDNNSRSFIFLEDYREEKDKIYSDVYTSDIYRKFQSIDLGEVITELTTLKAIEDQNLYELLSNYSLEIKTSIEATFLESIKAIKEADSFITRYSPILKYTQNYDNFLFESTKTIEDIFNLDAESVDLRFPIRSEFIFLYNSTFEITKFSEWNAQFKQYLTSAPSIFDRFILYVGSMLKKFGDELFSSELPTLYRNYGLLRLIKAGSVQTVYIQDDFNVKLSEERKLNDLYDIIISENVNNEMLPSPLKTVLPGLETIDFIDFQEYLEMVDPEDFDENELEKRVRFLILSEIGRRKQNLSNALETVITLFQAKKFNFKTLYIENIIRDILSTIKSVISGLENQLDPNSAIVLYDSQTQTISTNNTIISNKVVAMLDVFLIKNSEEIALNESLINAYREIWNYYFGSAIELVEKALVSEARAAL